MPHLLDVNALIARAWDGHVHHDAMRAWWNARDDTEWRTCAITELGFLRISANARILEEAVPLGVAHAALVEMRALPGHGFLGDDVSPADADVPTVHGHRQLTDAHLLTLARRHGAQLVTFDAGIAKLDGGDGVVTLLR